MGNTSILITAQARGGKFLGPDINFSYVWVKDAASGHVFAEGAAGSSANNNDSGNLCPDALVSTCPTTLPANGSSTGVVLTYSDPTADPVVRYLTADKSTASFLASFDLAQPTLLEIVAAGADRRIRGSSTMWVVPGMKLEEPPGFVVEIPGLAVTVQDVYRVKDAVEVNAKVTMMCGCPINNAKTANPLFIPWPENEFIVFAELWAATKLSSRPMSLYATSMFAGTVPLPPGVDPRLLTLWVTAVQPKTSNVGAGSYALGG